MFNKQNLRQLQNTETYLIEMTPYKQKLKNRKQNSFYFLVSILISIIALGFSVYAALK